MPPKTALTAVVESVTLKLDKEGAVQSAAKLFSFASPGRLGALSGKGLKLASTNGKREVAVTAKSLLAESSKRLATLEAALEEAHSPHCNCHETTGRRYTLNCPEECESAWNDLGSHPHPFIDPCCLSWRTKVSKA